MRYRRWFLAGVLVVGALASTTSPALTLTFTTIGDGNFTVFDAPNAASTEGRSINAGGDVTGLFFETQKSAAF